MTTYISILRGINVGGSKSIKMDALRQLFDQLEFSNTQSYIQSGNLFFEYKEEENEKLEKIISKNILDTFGHVVPVLVLKFDEFKRIIENNPFITDRSKDPVFLHLTFLASTPEKERMDQLLTTQSSPDEIKSDKQAIYLYCPNGYGNTKFTNNLIESKLKTTATTRNWKTVNELLNLSNSRQHLHSTNNQSIQ